MAYFIGLCGFITGLIIAIIIAVAMTIFSSYYLALSNLEEGSSFGFSWLSIILFPILYGIGGFLMGLIFTPIYNLILKIIHGVDLDIEIKSSRAK